MADAMRNAQAIKGVEEQLYMRVDSGFME